MTHGTPDKELEVIPLSRKDSGLQNCTTGNAKGVVFNRCYDTQEKLEDRTHSHPARHWALTASADGKKLRAQIPNMIPQRVE
jgi:hypothetical protein